MKKHKEELLKLYLEEPEKLLDDIDTALDNLPIEEIPVNLLSSKDKDDPYRSSNGSRPYHKIFEVFLGRWNTQLQEKICEDLKYCESKKIF